MKLIDAFKAFWSVLTGTELVPAVKMAKLEARATELEVELSKASESSKRDLFAEGATYALVLLQREGRLVDFIQESIDTYSDEQIGIAARSIHAGCAKVLGERFDLTPIAEQAEGVCIELSESYDPCEYKMTGNTPTKPPFRGTLTHRGWKVGKVSFPDRSDSINPAVVQSAEVEC